jgi:glycine oxidase
MAAAVDHVVVGAGVIGLTLAHELLSRGKRVVVLDRGRPGGGATDTAGGMLAPILEAEHEPPPLVELALDSQSRFPELVARLEAATGTRCGYRTEGTLCVARDRDDMAELEHLSCLLEDRGLGCSMLAAEEVCALEPHLSSRVRGGLDVRRDHQIDPRALSRTLVAAIERLEGVIRQGVIVEEVEARAGRVVAVRGLDAEGAGFRLEVGSVTVAAGAWMTRDIRLPSAVAGLRPVKGQLLRLHGPRLLERVVRSPDVYLIPRAAGELLVGATMEEMGFDETASAGAVMDLLRHAWEIAPGIYDLELREVCVGLRSAVDDHMPVVGPTEVEGLHVAVGHFRNGVLLAPATAHYLADTIESGVAPPALEPFSPSRLKREALS